MKIIAINGSARKSWNTHSLLSKALEGAESVGAKTELINLYDLDYKGCTSCMLCKAKGSKSLGHCAVNDDLKPVLDRIEKSDGLILGSPIYFGEITAAMRALLERLLFQYLNYDDYSKPLFTGKLNTAFVYTMNAPENYFADLSKRYETLINSFFDYKGTVFSGETLQVENYSKFHLASFNEADRKDRREKVFPKDCQKAYELGKALASAE